MKTKTMTLTRCVGSRFDEDKRSYVEEIYFRVEQLTDSIAYAPGAKLDPETVGTLCEQDDWKITVKGPKQ